jgi:hypothetical protein
VRRALAVVQGVEVEILEGAEAVGPAGDVVVASPDLDHVDQIIISGRRIPVLPLPAMRVLLDATGKRERAAMVARVDASAIVTSTFQSAAGSVVLDGHYPSWSRRRVR